VAVSKSAGGIELRDGAANFHCSRTGCGSIGILKNNVARAVQLILNRSQDSIVLVHHVMIFALNQIV
jgi:hypothetical protein